MKIECIDFSQVLMKQKRIYQIISYIMQIKILKMELIKKLNKIIIYQKKR